MSSSLPLRCAAAAALLVRVANLAALVDLLLGVVGGEQLQLFDLGVVHKRIWQRPARELVHALLRHDHQLGVGKLYGLGNADKDRVVCPTSIMRRVAPRGFRAWRSAPAPTGSAPCARTRRRRRPPRARDPAGPTRRGRRSPPFGDRPPRSSPSKRLHADLGEGVGHALRHGAAVRLGGVAEAVDGHIARRASAGCARAVRKRCARARARARARAQRNAQARAPCRWWSGTSRRRG